MHDADERDVVDLVRDVVVRRAADRGLELAGEVREPRVADVVVDDRAHGGGAVDDLVGRDTGDGGPEDDARAVAARLLGAQPDGLEPAPDLRDVLDADPVQLDVLPVGDVRGAAAELDGDVRDGAQLLQAQRAAVAAHPEHEVLVVELVRLQRGGLAAVDAGLALRVEPPPAHTSAQVLGRDAREALAGVDVLDPLPDVERVVLLLEQLVAVQRFLLVERPLALGTSGGRGDPGLRHRAISPGERGRAPAPSRWGERLSGRRPRARGGRGAGSVAPRTAAHAQVRGDDAAAPTREAEPGGDHQTRLSRRRRDWGEGVRIMRCSGRHVGRRVHDPVKGDRSSRDFGPCSGPT